MQKENIHIRNRKASSPAVPTSFASNLDGRKSFSYSLPATGAIVFALVLLAYLLWSHQSSHNRFLSTSKEDAANPRTRGALSLSSPSYATEPVQQRIAETLTIYQLPPCPTKEIVGIVFIAHGCSHSATDFWPSSKACPDCIGLPQEVKLVTTFLENKFIVVAIDSLNRHNKCWSGRADMNNLDKILTELRQKQQWEYPLLAFGASSGGTMIGHLATEQAFVDKHRLKGIIVQIANINNFRWIRIPVLYNFMSKDIARKEITLKAIGEMRLFFIHTQPSLVPMYRESKPLTITERFFVDHLPSQFDESLSQQVYQLFAEHDIIDANGQLIKDPRKHTYWKGLLKSAPFFTQLKDGLISDESPIQEMMNVAYGYHELTAEFAQDFVKFCTLIATNNYNGEFDSVRKAEILKPVKHRTNNWRIRDKQERPKQEKGHRDREHGASADNQERTTDVPDEDEDDIEEMEEDKTSESESENSNDDSTK